jgi:hypothetical protein
MVPANELECSEKHEIIEDLTEALDECRDDEYSASVLAFHIAKLTDIERSRLMCRRLGYCNSALLPRMCGDDNFGTLPNMVSLNEDNAILDEAKFKKQAHLRNDPELSQGKPPWWRVYVDGGGGGQSMGCESYEEAIGSYLFV